MASISASKRVWDSYYYFFPFYMMTYLESALLHLFIITFFSFIAWGIYSCVPSYVPFAVGRGYFYLTGLNLE